MVFENDYKDEKAIPNNQVIVCLTCAVGHAGSPDVAEDIWNSCAWNVTRQDEEEEAVSHSANNPHHIVIRGLDIGYRLNRK